MTDTIKSRTVTAAPGTNGRVVAEFPYKNTEAASHCRITVDGKVQPIADTTRPMALGHLKALRTWIEGES